MSVIPYLYFSDKMIYDLRYTENFTLSSMLMFITRSQISRLMEHGNLNI